MSDWTTRTRVRAAMYVAAAVVGVGAVGTAGAATVPPDQVSVHIAGVARDSERLAVQLLASPGEARVPLSIQWERCDASGSPCAVIRGATIASYTAGPRDVGSRLRAAVRVP